MSRIIADLVECRVERRLQRLQKQLQRFHLLLLDELEYVPFSTAGAELLFEIINSASTTHRQLSEEHQMAAGAGPDILADQS